MSEQRVFAYLRVHDADRAIRFYQQAFDAREIFRLTEPGGRIGHAELELLGSVLMLSDAFPEFDLGAPAAGSSQGSTIHLHVDNADASIGQAVAAGATLQMAAQDQFYGERSGAVLDPFGHRWLIGHPIEALSPQEMQRRYDAIAAPTAAQGDGG